MRNTGKMGKKAQNQEMDNGTTSESFALEILRRHLKTEHGYSEKDIIMLLKSQGEDFVPASIFCARLSTLEAVVKYLREKEEWSIKRIAKELSRSGPAISITYSRAREKILERSGELDWRYKIPIKKLARKKLSMSEAVVVYLKDTYGLSNHKIAVILCKDDRTIWTMYARAKEKK